MWNTADVPNCVCGVQARAGDATPQNNKLPFNALPITITFARTVATPTQL
jgi:hypothetical protein